MFLSFITPLLPPGIDSPSPIGPYLNGVFPTTTPGTGTGNWEVELAYPNLTFVDPVALVQIPGQSAFYVAGKTGLVWKISNNAQTSTKTTVLNFSSRVDTHGDAGLLNLILHPQFGVGGSPNRGYMYVVYRYHPNAPVSCTTGAFTRLSRFTKPDGSDTIDPNSEFVMIQQYDQHCWHNGSGMFFGSDGFLYVTFGDAGGANDEHNTSQQIDRMLLGGLMRIDINRNPATSHPVRRQPVDPPGKPAGLPASFTQGYYIPNDNPWLSTGGAILEEFYSVGLRSPHRASYDAATGTIWVGDVGQGAREEVTLIEKGANSQWPYREGSISGPKSKPSPLIGFDKPPVYDYGHSVGNSVIGGFVYRGARYASSLTGKYIFGDHGVRNVWTLNPANGEVTFLVNIPASGSGGKNGISSFATDANGEVYILKLYGTNEDGGRIYKLKQSSFIGDPPRFLSDVGAFSNLANLTPVSGLVPYTVNTPLWSDGALKKRWIALPNNGTHNTPAEQITFSATSEWQFPAGTVFVKHFELPVNENNPAITKRVETRFLVRAENGGIYGVTYKWNDEQTDAELLTTGDTKIFTITKANGTQGTQVWSFPSRTDCTTCHNANANFVLGVKTWQLNGNFTYPSGIADNQLNTWHHLNMFANPFSTSQIPGFLKSIPLENSSASLEVRVRSYIDANCANCHRPNGVDAAFDARFSVPLASQNLINVAGVSPNTPAGKLIVKPGDHANSEIWVRDNSVNAGNSMPPLAKNLAHSEYITVLKNWINSLGACLPAGTPCNDGNPNTVNDVEDGNCHCAGTPNMGDCTTTYLSTLNWVAAQSTSYGTIKKNLSYSNNPLTIGGNVYASGIGTHADASIVYQINGAYDTFTSYVGVDDECGTSGSVIFRVYKDGSLAAQTPLLTNASAPYLISVDISGVNQLRLVADNGNGSINCDHADWADARLESCDGSCTPGTACNDGNVSTYNDTYNSQCICTGIPCPPAGTACNDGNPNTTNDVADGNCNCAGTPVCPPAGTPCNDGNPNTTNDVADGNCNCAGTPVCPPAGTPCNDGNPNTTNDVEDGNCHCAGSPDTGDCTTTYLSALNWVAAQSTSYGTIKKNLSYNNNPLRIGGNVYTSGIGTHADASIVYRINGAYDTFESFVGVDDECGTSGSVIFRVYKDGSLAAQTPLLTNASTPYLISIDVSGVTELRLVADNGNGSINCDHADWADAKLENCSGTTSLGVAVTTDQLSTTYETFDNECNCKEPQGLETDDYLQNPANAFEISKEEQATGRELADPRPSGRLQVKASPNPFREELNIFIGKPIPELKEAIVRIIDENGRIMYQRFNVPFNEEVTIPLHAGWTNGLYFLRVQASEYVETVRVIKH